MGKKSKLIKNLLTTASAVAVLVGGVNSAMGGANPNVATTADIVALQDGGAVNLSAAFNNGVGIQYDDNRAITTGGDVVIRNLDINGKAPGPFTVEHSVTLGSVGDIAGGGGSVNFVINDDNKILTLSGTDGANATIDLSGVAKRSYAKFGNIDVDNKILNIVIDTATDVAGNLGLINGSTDNGDGTFSRGITLTGNITNGKSATLDVKTDLKANGTFGDLLKANIGTVAAAATFELVITGNLNLQAANGGGGLVQKQITFVNDDSLLKISHDANDRTVTIVGETLGGKNAAHNAVADNRGIIEFVASPTKTLTIAGTNPALQIIGGDNTHRIKELRISGGDNANAGTVDITTASFAKKLTLDGNTATKISANADSGANSTVSFNDARAKLSVDNATFTAASIEFNKDATVEFANAASKVVGDIKNLVKNAGVQVANQGTIRIVTNGAIVGSVGADAAANNGANGAALKLINFTDDKTLTVQGATLFVEKVTQTKGDAVANASGTLKIGGIAADGKITVATSTETNKFLAAFTVDARAGGGTTAATLKGKISAAAVNLSNGAHELILAANSALTATDVKLNNADARLTFGGDTVANATRIVSGAISGGAAGQGIIDVKQDGQITGTIGAGVNTLKTIVFTEAKTLTVNNNGVAGVIKADTGISFATDAILKLTGDNIFTITSPVLVVTGTKGGKGTIAIDVGTVVNREVTIDGAIGDKADVQKSLKSLTLAAGSDLKLTGGDVFINKLDLKGDNTVILGSANTYKFVSIENGADQGIIQADAAVTVDYEGDTTVKLADIAKLKAININGDNVVSFAHGTFVLATSLNNALTDKGTLTFLGDATFDVAMGKTVLGAGVATKIKTINVTGGAAKTVKYLSSAEVSGDVNINTAGNLEFSGIKLTAANVTGDVANAILKLNFAKGEQEINAPITNKVKVEFAGGDVKFTGISNSSSYTFNSENAINVNLGTATFDAADFTVNKDVINTVKFNTDGRIIAGNLGAKALVFEGGANAVNITVDSANAAKAQFTTTIDTAKFNTGANATTIASVGTSTKAFAELNIGTAAVSIGEVWANKITVDNDKAATFTGAVNGEVLANNLTKSIVLNDAGSKVIFTNKDFVLSTNIVGKVVSAGNVEFGDVNGSVNALIGADAANVKSVKFSAVSTADVVKTVKLGNDIHSDTIAFGKATFAPSVEVVTLDGAATFTDSTIDLGVNNIVSTGGDATFNGNITLATSFDGTDSGAFKKDVGNTLVFNDGSKLSLVVNDLTNSIARDSKSIIIIDNEGNVISDKTKTILSAATLTVQNNNLVNWTLSVAANGTATLTRVNNAETVLTNDIVNQLGAGATEEIANIKLFLDASAGSAAGNVADSLVAMNPEKRAETIQRLTETTEGSVTQVIDSVNNVVGSRIASFASSSNQAGVISPESRRTASAETGIAAGDDAERFGIWGSPFYSTATQKKDKTISGYKAEAAGITVGVDTKINDDLVLGGAFTFADTNVKHKEGKKGDKTKAESKMFSVYGMQQLTQNWFVQGSGTVGDNSIRTDSVRVASNVRNEIAKGKYSSMSFAGEVMFGYGYGLGMLDITPMFGMRYSRVNDGGYKETGTANQNLDISKKASNKFEGIAGARVSLPTVDMNGIMLSPEVHGFATHDFINKTPQVDIRLDGLKKNLEEKSAKGIKTVYNIGLGLNAKYGMMEYGAGYDAHLAKKYIGHQGTVKLRVNF